MKKITIKTLSVLLAFAIIFGSLIISPFALDFIGSGSGTSGGGSVGASGGYTLVDTDNCQGYRFSYVDSNGNKKPNGRVDVIKASEQTNFAGRAKFARRLNKKELITLYNNKVNFNLTTETVAAGNNVTWIDSALTLKSALKYSFNTMATDMEKWQGSDVNLNTILSKMNTSYSVSKMSPGDMIIIEPIIFCKFNNTNYAVTLQELWTMAGSMFGYWVQASLGGNDGTYNRIAYRVNGTFPNSLYTANGKGLWTNATKLPVPTSANGSAGSSFSNLILKGYGVCIAYTNVNYVTYEHWLGGLPTGTGTNANKNAVLLYKNSETYSGTISVTTNKFVPTSKLPKGISSDTSHFSSNSFGGSWVSYNFPKTFTGQTGGKSVQLYYNPTVYNITYNLNGGTLAKANPSTYTVLQGASFTNSPTKAGYTFLGWYINNEKVLGVNVTNLASTVIVNNTGTTNAPVQTLYYAINTRTTGNLTVEAKWSKNEDNVVTATFDANGGTTATPRTITRTPYTPLGTLPTTTRTGYTFNGWYTSKEGGSKITPDTLMPATDTTYYGRWTPNTYTIKFNGNGSTSGSTASMSMTYDVAKNLTANGFTRTGYTFNGWNTNSSGTGTNYVDKQSVINLTTVNGGTVTLYAKWTQNQSNTRTATFDANGGTTASPEKITRTPGAALGTLPTTTRTGHTFNGWYTSKDGGSKISSTTPMPSTDTTYYAHWTPNTYTIKFNGNGSTGGSTASMSMTFDVAKNLTANGFTRTGYTFNGWNTNSSGTGTNYVDKQSVKNLTTVNGGTVTLYAKWTSKQTTTYTVEYDANGGTNAPATQTKTKGVDLTLSSQKPTRTGYTFTNWCNYRDGDSTLASLFGKKYNPSDKYTEDKNTTLYAQWTPNTYTIKFNGNGSTGGSTASMSMTFDVAKNLTANGFTRTGYTFNGWNTNSSGTGTNYTNQQSVKNLTTVNGGTVTLYAKWTKNQTQYTATFDANGGTTATPRTITRTAGTALGTLPTTNRTGYSFDGWYTSASGGTEIYSTTKMPASNVTYYAHWIPNELTICYDCYGSNSTINTSKGYKFDSTTNKRLCTTTYTNKEVAGTQNVYYHTLQYGQQLGGTGLHNFADFGLTAPVGYKFSGWKSGDNDRVFDETTTTYTASDFTSDITGSDTYVWLTAQFTPIQYVATFDANGGTTASPKTITRTAGTALGTLPTTTRTGYTLTGWYTSASGGTQITASTPMPAYNVTYYAHWTPNKAELQLQPIVTSNPYTEGTEVVTSFYLINSSNTDCIPGNNVAVKFTVSRSNGTVIKTVTKSQVVVPKNDYNLIYFKWTVPTGLNKQDVKVSGEIVEPSKTYGKVTGSYKTKPKAVSNTPDTQFEKNMPSGFSIVKPPATAKQNATWDEWTYSSGKFVKKHYGVTINSNNTYIEPKTGSTHQYKNDMWYMKSGYGIGLTLNNGTSTVSGYSAPPTAAYTAPQTAYALFPEYKYVASAPYYQTLNLSSGQWIFPGIHYTPLWYPNGKYIVSVTQTDMWTPAGMIKRTSNSNEIRINGSAYDDWYVGR